MRPKAFAPEAARLSVATAALFTSYRSIINGVASDRIPRGMRPLGVLCSEDVLEGLAEAYVNMDAVTMTAFHKKAMTEMLRSSCGGSQLAAVHYEGQLLQAMGSGGEGSLATPVAAAAPGGDAATPEKAVQLAERAPERTAFDVILKRFTAENRISLIKELRAVCGLSIQEAKTAVDNAPGVIARQAQRADAEKLRDAMVNLGAEVELV
ncbi:hypothetical protein CUR178_02856 [Leishmania enriettii]|uniref:Large ribosomal subunit protein bL12 C-terminal domain-containing protein n=1 Tax=Leishmania enriettii TaxID=5663 RepID=A0A836H886_LEIEN|nr:hypothetical protein CUR178_02856 [Leishmania enriettii]